MIMKTTLSKSIVALSAITFAAFTGCTSRYQPKENDSPTRVKIATVTESDAMSKLDYVGIIEEQSSTALSFSSMGTIEKIFVSEGDYVSEGKLLAKLDPTSAQSMLDAASATLKQAQDGYNRLKSVHDKGSLTEVQMVDIETKLQQAQSSYNLAKKNLDNCSLYSPVSGVVGKKMAEPGEYSVVGKAILTILDISSVRVKFSVPENEISLLKSNCRSVTTIAALGNKKCEGGRIERSVTASAVSHTYPVHINLLNPQKDLLPGMVCKVELTPGDKVHSIVVPIGLIQTTADGQKFIWCEKEGKAIRTFVTTGTARGNGVEITSGLSVDDRLVTEGYQKISEDEKITGK
jgi:membrane fusion protein, multidrug efflux system